MNVPQTTRSRWYNPADVTDPGTIGSAATQAQALFHAIAEAASNAGVGVVVTRTQSDTELEVVYLNDALAHLLEAPAEEIRRVGPWAFLAAEELPRIHELNAARARGETLPSTFRTMLRAKSGRQIPVELALGVVELDGKPANVIFLVDISSRANAEAALQRSQALLERVVTNAPDGIYILRWPIVRFTNPAGARILDVPTPADAVGIDLSERMTPNEAAVAEDRIEQKRRGVRLDGPRQYLGRNPNGREFALEITSIPIEFDGGPAVLSFARDVTDRNDMLKKLGDTETLTAMNTLAAGVAHEINNPLAYLLLNLELLARELRDGVAHDPERTASMQRRLDDARQGAERVKAIVRDLQALTRKDENIRGPVEMDQVVENALSLARHETRNRCRIETHVDGPLCVMGNSTRLEQLLFNLVVNAAHAMKEERAADNLIRITLRRDDPSHMSMDVVDNGCGMTEDVQRRAFEPFFTTKPLGVGSGLGLPICKRIVEDLGGQIAVHSQPDVGTTVSVRLALWTERGAAHPAQTPAAAARRRGRVLVVDDERAVAESLRFALKDSHDVDTAITNVEARNALDSGVDYDVVLCDLVMPVESGMELHAHARERHPALAERFVFMTGGAFTPRTERFLRESRQPRIEKPFELEALRGLIDGMVSARAAE